MTFIAALRQGGVEAPWLIKWPINGERFLIYAEQVPIQTLKSSDIGIMDNLDTHKRKSVLDAIRTVGARLLLLPKYSPEPNSIEQFFVKLKHHLQKAQERFANTLCSAIGRILEIVTPPECSNYLENAGYVQIKLVSIQPEFSPRAVGALFAGVLDQAMERGLTVLAWSPLAGGRLLGASGDTRTLAVIAELDRIAAANNVGRAAVAYAWILAHPSRPIPLIGSQTPARIREAADAFKVQFTDADWYAVLQAALGAPLP